MKRSEMLAKIREKLIGTVSSDAFENDILDTVEELGMHPPVKVIHFDVFESQEIYEWEPETQGFITAEQARELLDLPLKEGETAAGKFQMVRALLNPPEESEED